MGQEATIRIVCASIWTSPVLYGWLAGVLAIIAVLYVALLRGRRAQAIADAARDAEMQVKDPASAPRAAVPVAATPSSPPSHRPDGSSDDFATVYLYLISALDQANARGDLSQDAYTLIRKNLKRKLEVVLSDGATRARP